MKACSRSFQICFVLIVICLQGLKWKANRLRFWFFFSAICKKVAVISIPGFLYINHSCFTMGNHCCDGCFDFNMCLFVALFCLMLWTSWPSVAVLTASSMCADCTVALFLIYFIWFENVYSTKWIFSTMHLYFQSVVVFVNLTSHNLFTYTELICLWEAFF